MFYIKLYYFYCELISLLKNIFFMVKNRLVFMLFFCNLRKSFLAAFNLLNGIWFFFLIVFLLNLFLLFIFWITYILYLYLGYCAKKLALFLFIFFLIYIFICFVIFLFICIVFYFLFLGFGCVLISFFFFRFICRLLISFFSDSIFSSSILIYILICRILS